MKMRKAMALALAGALVLTTVATGITSEAAKKTKLKTKKVSIFVKGKKKISITGKKAKHKYTFTSKKKKIAKVSKTGVITGVKAGKTTITVKDTWKQKGKKKSKKLGTINVTVKKKTTPKPKVTANVPQVTPQPPAPATQDPNGGGSQPPVPTPDNSGNQPDDPTPTPSGNPDDPTPTPTPSGNPDDPTPTPSDNPDIKEPTAEMTLAKHAITEESATTAEVSVSAGEVKDVTWSVEKANVAEAAKDAKDAKKAVITGKAVGETKITAEVKVTVEGKDFTVKAEQDLTVAAKDALVVNASIESAPTEMTVGDAVELKVAADVGTIESVVWAVEGEAATVETDSVDVVKAVLKAVKPGVVMVSATVTVKDGDKTATDTAKATINVKEPTSYNLDLTEFDAKGQNVIVNNDGSIEITHLASYQGTGISVSEGVTCVELSAVSYQDGQELDGQQQIQLYDTEGNKIAETYNKGAITLVVPKGKTLGKIVVNAQNASPNKPQTMKIDYIRVHKYNSISLDLSKFDPKSGTVVVNDDGSIKVTHTAAYTGAGIEVGDVKGTIKYISVGGLPQQQKQVKIENSAGEDIVGAQYFGEELLFEIPEDKTPAKVVVNAQDINAQPEISIGYITLYVEE